MTTHGHPDSSGRHAYDIVVIAASRGGIEALRKVLASLPRDFPVPVAIVQHRSAALPNYLAEVLGRRALLPVKFAEQGEALQPYAVYLAPPHLHLTVSRDHTFGLHNGSRIRNLRSSANPLFATAADVFGSRVLAVVLTGGDRDATDGVQSVKQGGGTVIAQDEGTSEDFAMPKSAIETGCVDMVLPLEEIGPAIIRLVHGTLVVPAL